MNRNDIHNKNGYEVRLGKTIVIAYENGKELKDIH